MTPAITLFQAEWCPYSSAVRELLTELGQDFVARQVPAWPEERHELRRLTGSDTIPVLQTAAGETFVGTPAIFAYLETLDAWTHASAHRERYVDHLAARQSDVPGQLVERARISPANDGAA